MAKARIRIRRTFFLVLALCALALLLELNRFLPGSWPGGGRGGFQAASSGGSGTPPGEHAQDPEQPDASTLAPPETRPEAWPPRDGLRIEMRGPDGELETRWRLGAGRSGRAEEEPDARGTVTTSEARILEEGFRALTGSGLVRHQNGLGTWAAKWVVHRPQAKLPKQRDAGRAGVLIVEESTGKPLEGIKVDWRAGDQQGQVVSDATGEAVLPGTRDGHPIQISVDVPQQGRIVTWISPNDPTPRRVEVDETVEVRVKLDFPAGEAGRARLVRPHVLSFETDGSQLYESRLQPPREEGAPATARVRRRTLDNAWLWLILKAQGNDYFVRHRLRGQDAVYALPDSRRLTVRVRDTNGRPVTGAEVQPRYPDLEPGEEESFSAVRHNMPRFKSRTGPSGMARSIVPTGVPVRLLIEAPGARPIVRSVTTVDGNADLEFVVEPGIQVPMRVLGADGKPMGYADLQGRSSVDGVRILRRGAADADGRAALGPFAEGPVELFVRADRHAWRAVLVDARPAMGTVEVRLAAGYPLNLVVEDPFGVPLEGAEVTITPADGGAPLVAPPDFKAWRTDPQGMITVPDLPNRLYDVRVSHSGRAAATLRRLQPGAVTHFVTLVRAP